MEIPISLGTKVANETRPSHPIARLGLSWWNRDFRYFGETILVRIIPTNSRGMVEMEGIEGLEILEIPF